MTLLWLLGFLGSLILMFALVPRDRIVKFLPFGMLAGFGVGVFFLYFTVNVLAVWKFVTPGIFVVFGFPILMAASWTPLEIGFAHYFPKKNSWWLFAGYLLILPALSTLFHWYALTRGNLLYFNWNLTTTFLTSVIIHAFLAYYLYTYEFKHTLNKL